MMIRDSSISSRIFDLLIYIVLILAGLSCVLPLIHVLSISLSDKAAVGGGLVKLWPVRPTLAAYDRLIREAAFFRAAWISIMRTTIGTVLNMTLTALVAYPLAQSPRRLKYRNILMAVVIITMYFNAGLIPTYMVVRKVGLLNTFWSMIFPMALPVWNVVLLMNFFRSQPYELEEAALIDGATPPQIAWHVALPIAQPALATLTLFCIISHWNQWFDALIYLNSPKMYPLQTYLYGQIVGSDIQTLLNRNREELAEYYNQETLRAAQIFLATLPIIVVYPLLQRHFVTGIVIGSVKG
jgi:putative aldouronate transport system permease protein